MKVVAQTLHGDGNRPPVSNGLDGVRCEVVEDGQDRVGVEFRQAGGDIRREGDALLELARVLLLRVDDQMAELERRHVVVELVRIVLVRQLAQCGIDALTVLLDVVDFSCYAQRFLRDARQIFGVVQAAQLLVDAVAVVRGCLRPVQRLLELKDFLVDTRDHHRQAVLLVQLVGEVNFRQVEL